eukprot:gene15442-biopygen9712
MHSGVQCNLSLCGRGQIREKRPRPRPVRVHFFKFYRAPRVRSASGPRPLPFSPGARGFKTTARWPGNVRGSFRNVRRRRPIGHKTLRAPNFLPTRRRNGR